MAKQIGIHQIRGKVGERCYYRTKGVESGLSRSINQGMSARVKNGEEYSNTRLNNAEFKNANSIATAAFNSVNTRKRGMMRNFAISAMTKAALADIKQGTGAWGVRLPHTELDTLIVDLLERHAKGGVYDGMYGTFDAGALSAAGSAVVSWNISEEQVTLLKELGIDGVQVIVSKCLAGEIIVDELPRLFAGNSIYVTAPQVFPATSEISLDLTIDVSTPANVGMSQSGYTFAQQDTKHGFYAVATILPFRGTSGVRHVLQEYCTYVALPLGQIPEP